MKGSTQRTMKAVGTSLAIGAAVAMIGSSMSNSTSKNMKKTAKKAIGAFSNIVDNMQGLM